MRHASCTTSPILITFLFTSILLCGWRLRPVAPWLDVYWRRQRSQTSHPSTWRRRGMTEEGDLGGGQVWRTSGGQGARNEWQQQDGRWMITAPSPSLSSYRRRGNFAVPPNHQQHQSSGNSSSSNGISSRKGSNTGPSSSSFRRPSSSAANRNNKKTGGNAREGGGGPVFKQNNRAPEPPLPASGGGEDGGNDFVNRNSNSNNRVSKSDNNSNNVNNPNRGPRRSSPASSFDRGGRKGRAGNSQSQHQHKQSSQQQQQQQQQHHQRYHQQRRGQQQEWNRQRREQQQQQQQQLQQGEGEEGRRDEDGKITRIPPGAEDEASLSDFTRLCQVLSLSADQYPESPEELAQVFGTSTAGATNTAARDGQRASSSSNEKDGGDDGSNDRTGGRGGNNGYSNGNNRTPRSPPQQQQQQYQQQRGGGGRRGGNDNNDNNPSSRYPPRHSLQQRQQQYQQQSSAQLMFGVEEVLAPVEKLGLRKRSAAAGTRASTSSSSSSSSLNAAADTGKFSDRRGGGGSDGARQQEPGDEEEEVDPMDEDENIRADEDEEASDDEDFALSKRVQQQGSGGGGGDGDEDGVLMMKDRRVVSSQIKDAKLTEYIKDKKKARSSRDRFLADTGLVRSEVHPPQRFIEVYYNSWADDFYTAITTSSSSFGPRWWFREALGHDPHDVMAWVKAWRDAAIKHDVLHEEVAAIIQEALALGRGGNGRPGGAAADDGNDDEEVCSPQVENERFAFLKARLRERREPKVIAIGDVHGCIMEVRALIKKLQYSPGDLIVFLGDMVAKGPESVEVIRLAREIGALSVRGNHENEVVRWSRALALGAQSNFKSEHYLIATGLSLEDIEWLRNLPWYISCSDLQLLFVHAGFVSNQRLSKQHPRFLINMRSILADGTVSARYYQEYPWARTWQGPQTVLFGHDARRGMQLYDQALGLDTGCVYGGNLTACILPGKEFVQVEAAEPYIVNRYDRIMKRAQTLQKAGGPGVRTTTAMNAGTGKSPSSAEAEGGEETTSLSPGSSSSSAKKEGKRPPSSPPP